MSTCPEIAVCGSQIAARSSLYGHLRFRTMSTCPSVAAFWREIDPFWPSISGVVRAPALDSHLEEVGRHALGGSISVLGPPISRTSHFSDLLDTSSHLLDWRFHRSGASLRSPRTPGRWKSDAARTNAAIWQKQIWRMSKTIWRSPAVWQKTIWQQTVISTSVSKAIPSDMSAREIAAFFWQAEVGDLLGLRLTWEPRLVPRDSQSAAGSRGDRREYVRKKGGRHRETSFFL